MSDYQHSQLVYLLRAIALGIVGVAITVGSFVAGQIAVFLALSTDDARLATLSTAAVGAAFTACSLWLVLMPPREKYSVEFPERKGAQSVR